MKADKMVTAVIALILSVVLALGAVGCLTTAFSLNLEDPGKVVALCIGTCLFGTVIFSWKQGWILGLLAGIVMIAYQWRLGEFAGEFWQLVYRISHVYNQAYHWGVLQLVDTPWNAGYADLPITALGMVLGGAAAWAVCRGKGASFPVCMSLLPLLLCVVVTDTVPAAGCLYLLILGQIMLTLTGGVRRENAYQGNRLTFLAALPVAAALALVFLAIPKEGYVSHAETLREQAAAWFQSLPRQGTEILESIVSRPAAPDTLNLAALGRRLDSQEEVMAVAAETGGTLYLRGRDYDIYDGTAWRTTGNRVEEFGCEGVNLGYVVVETRQEMEELYLPYYPRDPLSLIGGKYDNLRITQSYSFVRRGLPENWQELAASGDQSAAADSRYLELPEDTRIQARNLLSSVLGQESTVVEKARAIASYVRQSAVYDKNTDPMSEGAGDFAMWFLGEGETGYCVHFATASVVLLRAAGIPARYVSGYMLPARAGETEPVTGENAHAWAEYYVPGLNTWLILEATPPEGQPGGGQETREETLPETTSAPTAAPPTEAPIQTQPPVPAATEPVPAVTTHQPEEEREALPAWVGQAGSALLVLILIAGLTEGQYRLRRSLRRWDQHRGGPNRMALRRWREAERLARLLRETPPREIKNLALKARFSQHTLTEEELETIDLWLTQAKASLKEKPIYLLPLYRYVFAAI